MNGLKSYMVRLGSLELATVIFWMLFWLANGLAKLIPGVNIGVKFAEKGDVNLFAVTLGKMGWGTGLGDFAFYFTGVVELLVGLIFTWALIQFSCAPARLRVSRGSCSGSSSAPSSSPYSPSRTSFRHPARRRSYGTPPTSESLAYRGW